MKLAVLLTALLVFAEPVGANTDRAKFLSLATRTSITPHPVDKTNWKTLLTFRSLDVATFKVATIHVDISSDYWKSGLGFTKSSKLRILASDESGRHGGVYFEQTLAATVLRAGIFADVDIPIVGESTTIVVLGEDIPETNLQANCFMRLVK